MPFCTECGNALDSGSNFCTNCGAKLSTSPVPDIPGIPGDNPPGIVSPFPDTVVAVIPNLMEVRGPLLRGPVWHHVVVTTQRIILVRRTLTRIEKIKQDIGVIGPDYRFYPFQVMKPDDILAENPESRVIPLHDLVSLTVTKKVLQSVEEGDQVFWEVTFLTKSGTITLQTDYGQDPGNYISTSALVNLLGKRLVTTNM